jgi:hypothetical protein
LQAQQHISGYYVNRIADFYKNEGENYYFDSARLSYFVPVELIPAAIQEIENFLNENKLGESRPWEYPHLDSIKLQYRQFLTLETLIGLELMEVDTQETQKRILNFRLKNLQDSSSISSMFDPAFQRSKIYRLLSNTDRNFLWSCLSKPDWSHHLVNLMLGFDPFNYSSIKDINKQLVLNKIPFIVKNVLKGAAIATGHPEIPAIVSITDKMVGAIKNSTKSTAKIPPRYQELVSSRTKYATNDLACMRNPRTIRKRKKPWRVKLLNGY